jgi:hypothetical protein
MQTTIMLSQGKHEKTGDHTMSSSLCMALFVALLCGALTSAREINETVEVKVDLNKAACPLLSVSGELDGVALPCIDVCHDEIKRERAAREKEKEQKKSVEKNQTIFFSSFFQLSSGQTSFSWKIRLANDSALPLGEKVPFTMTQHCSVGRCGVLSSQQSFTYMVMKGNNLYPESSVTVEGDRLRDLTLGDKDEFVVRDAALKQYTLGNVVLEAGANLTFQMASDQGELRPTQLRALSFKADEKATFVVQFPPDFVPVHDTAVELALVTTSNLDADKVLYVARTKGWNPNFQLSFSTSAEFTSNLYILKTTIRMRDTTTATTSTAETGAGVGEPSGGLETGAIDNTPLIAGAVGGSLLSLAIVALVVFLVRRRKSAAVAARASQPSANEYQAVRVNHPSVAYDVGQIERPREDDYSQLQIKPPSNYGVVNAEEPRYADPSILAPDSAMRGIVARDTGVGTNYGRL